MRAAENLTLHKVAAAANLCYNKRGNVNVNRSCVKFLQLNLQLIHMKFDMGRGLQLVTNLQLLKI